MFCLFVIKVISYNIIVPISFSHAAHADKVKRDFLESASNSANFLSRQSKIHCTS